MMPNANLPLPNAEFVALDLETTGRLYPVSCRIVEFGAARFKLAKGELHHFEQLVDPECPIPSDATRIDGITDAMVHGMPTVVETLPIFLAFLGRPNTVLLAHKGWLTVMFFRRSISSSRQRRKTMWTTIERESL